MKKTLALLMALLLMLTMAACAKAPIGTITENGNEQTAPQEDATPNEDATTNEDAPAEEETPEETLSFGETSGTVYENKTLGIGFKAPEGWTFKTKDELAALAGTTADKLGGDVGEMLKNSSIAYDMMAVSADMMTNVIVTFENIGTVNGILYDLDDYIDKSLSQLDDQLAATGAEVLSSEKATFTVDGKDFSGIKIHMKMSGVDTYQSMLCIKVGSYIGLVNVTTVLTDKTAEAFNNIYTL